ncbi:MAG: ZIP family metal transporter [archaeon]
MNVWFATLLSVIIVSILSLIGVLALAFKEKFLKKILLYLVSFAAGALFGDAFIHLIPEAVEEIGLGLMFSLSILAGILVFFILEKFIHWRHCHVPTSKNHPHPLGYMNLIGDGFHNFIDGMVIAASYVISLPLGIATTLAVILHEIPQEMGDFGILIYAGFTKTKALFFNFLSALFAVLGAVVVLILGAKFQNLSLFLLPFTAGGFIYIAGTDLIPELKKDCKPVENLGIFVALILGIGMMLLLTLLE